MSIQYLEALLVLFLCELTFIFNFKQKRQK